MKIYLRIEVNVPDDYDIDTNDLEHLLYCNSITNVILGNKNDFKDNYIQHFDNN